MKRVATVLLLAGVLFAPLRAQAQARGGGRVSGPASHVVAASRPAAALRLGTARPAPAYPITLRPALPRAIVRYYSPYYSPYYGLAYGGVYPFTDTYAPVQAPPQPSVYTSGYAGNDVADLSNQIQQLTAEVEQLRSDRMQREHAVALPAPGSATGSVPTILIFRDGHRMEIYNYAANGKTLWVLTEQSSMQIPLSELNLDATQAANRDNGVRLLIPR